MIDSIALDPVDSVEITLLVDNMVDPFVLDAGEVRRAVETSPR